MGHQHSTPSTNPSYIPKGKRVKSLEDYLRGLAENNRYILSECITLLESTVPSKRSLGETIMASIPAISTPSIRIGITGSPGVGKSTFIEALGIYLIAQNHRPAILAIDPSSQINKGSILGDKTRMAALSAEEKAYIRPTASGRVLGGTAAFTKEAVQLCEAAGYDMIIVETVGVGQSETEVDNITDVNILLLQPGAGDDLQGIKRGIVENADIFVINKADGKMLDFAKQTKISYQNAIHLFHHEIEGWDCPVILTSSIQNIGIAEVYHSILAYVDQLKAVGVFDLRRQKQEQVWFEKRTLEVMKAILLHNEDISTTYKKLSSQIQNNNLSTFAALQEMEKKLKSVLKD
ncbi:MAG: methylmalonyl Co-A mutase-associated GTPase MeaB [Saprospiraceae bacterium]